MRNIQMHPFKPKPLHVDFQRVKAGEKISLNVPLHTVNDERSPGVLQGGTVSHLMTEVEITCLPKNIPDSIEVDVGELEIGDTLHLSDLKTPSGVELSFDEETDHAVVTVAGVRAEPVAEVAEEVAEEAAAEEEAAGAEEEAAGEEAGGEEEEE